MTTATPRGPVPIATFWVGVRVHKWWGGGRLTVWPGAAVLTPGGWLRELTGREPLVHDHGEITMYRARLFPPWLNTAFGLPGGSGATVFVGFWRRRAVTAALTAAGFVVRERKTWLTTGYAGW